MHYLSYCKICKYIIHFLISDCFLQWRLCFSPAVNLWHVQRNVEKIVATSPGGSRFRRKYSQQEKSHSDGFDCHCYFRIVMVAHPGGSGTQVSAMHNMQRPQYSLSVPFQRYTCSASPHHAMSGAQSWRTPRGGKNKCTTTKELLREFLCLYVLWYNVNHVECTF